MVIFLDTSSLVKLYYNEHESKELEEKISAKAAEIFLSELSKVEFISALWKKVRMGEIETDTCKEVIKCFENDFQNFNWIYFDMKTIEDASMLIKNYGSKGLLTLNSLLLASVVN